MKKYIALCLTLILSIMTSCTSKEEAITFGIEKYPPVPKWNRGKLGDLPEYKEGEGGWQVDLRNYDLTEIDIKHRYEDLKYADFNTNTKWPKELPSNYDPKQIMELGKDPGLRIRELHNKGITGKGVSVAIIDQALLVDHEEYGERVKMYEEIHCTADTAQMHGPAVASILLGDTIGVAPKANLFYVAETHGEYNDDGFEYDFTYLAESIRRIIEVNKTLSDKEKIRVISISVGWHSSQKGYNEIQEVVEEAKENGIFVVSSVLSETYDGFNFHGLGRDVDKDPNSVDSYKPGMWWETKFYDNFQSFSKIPNETLLLPMDSRTTADPTGKSNYAFYRMGGWSWSIPYIAGLYALACQVEPNITPDQFWQIALETGDIIEIENEGKTYDFGKVANPVKLIEKIEEIN